MSEERRHDWEEMHTDIKEIKKILIGEKGDNGLCGRIGKAETKLDSVQSELTEHKEDTTTEKRIDRLDTRFWYLISGFAVSIFAFIVDRVK